MTRRRRDRSERQRPAADTQRYRRLRNPFRPLEVLSEKEKICPAGVRIRAVAQLVRDKAPEVSGPAP